MPNGTFRAIFRAAIPDFIAKGYSANAMVREARLWGVSYRRTDMLEDVRSFQGFFVKESRVRDLGRNELATPWHMQETDLRRLRRYRVWGDATYRDPLTGEEWSQTISMYDDVNREPDEWEAEFEREREEAQYRIGIELVGIDFRSIQHNKGWSY